MRLTSLRKVSESEHLSAIMDQSTSKYNKVTPSTAGLSLEVEQALSSIQSEFACHPDPFDVQ